MAATGADTAAQVERARRRFTREAYHRMGEAGILKATERLEADPGGRPSRCPRSAAVTLPSSTTSISSWSSAWPGGGIVSVQNPVVVAWSRLQLAAAGPGGLRRREPPYKDASPEPADALLLIEVADSSLGYDRTAKLRLWHAVARRHRRVLDRRLWRRDGPT